MYGSRRYLTILLYLITLYLEEIFNRDMDIEGSFNQRSRFFSSRIKGSEKMRHEQGNV